MKTASTKAKKSWAEKMKKPDEPEVKILGHAFADLEEGSKMLIPTPSLISSYLHNSEPGTGIDVKQMRKDLAIKESADNSCPLTTGIFLRIVSEYANELRESDSSMEQLPPVWRVLNPKLPLWKKLSFDVGWILKQREKEGIL